VAYSENWLHAEVHITADSMFAEDQGVPSWIGLEYLAQAISAYAGLQESARGEKPKIGFLLGSRKYVCSVDYFAIGQTLLLKVTKELQAENGLSAFQCVLSGDNITATATINVFQPDNAEEFLQDVIS